MFTQIGSCPKCGAPIYSPSAWWSITPAPITYTCACNPQATVYTTGNTSGYASVEEQKPMPEGTLTMYVTCPYCHAILHADKPHSCPDYKQAIEQDLNEIIETKMKPLSDNLYSFYGDVKQGLLDVETDFEKLEDLTEERHEAHIKSIDRILITIQDRVTKVEHRVDKVVADIRERSER